MRILKEDIYQHLRHQNSLLVTHHSLLFSNPNQTFNRHAAGTPLPTAENIYRTAGGKIDGKLNSNHLLTLSVATTGTRLPTVENNIVPRDGKNETNPSQTGFKPNPSDPDNYNADLLTIKTPPKVWGAYTKLEIG